MKSVQLIAGWMLLSVWTAEAQEFSGTIRILKSSDRVKIGGRSYKVKRTKGNSLSTPNRNSSCIYDGRLFRHGGSVQRACDRCMCFSGEVLCWKTQCPPIKVSKGCREVQLEEYCCPIIMCDPEVPLKNQKHQKFSAKKQRPYLPLPAKVNRYNQTECELDNRTYRYGQVVPHASGPCIQCRCGFGGQMECKTRKCPLTGALNLGRVAIVSQNTNTTAKPIIMIRQKDPGRALSS